MAVRTRGLTVTIDGDTTGLTKALESVNKEVKNTQAQLKDVDKLLKLDPTNTELLSQKQRLLGDAVSETRNKLDTLKTASDQANISLANGEISQEQFDALQREIAETTLELKRLEEQAKLSNTAVQEIAAKGEKLKTMGDNISSVGEKFLPATAAVVGLGTAAVKTASDFDTGMSKVAAISGATGSDLDALRDKAREMGAKTKFSASEAAAAMEYMAMAGWKTSDMLGGIEGIMNLAAASGEDLATTSDIVTDALTAFGLSANDAGHFADILAAASSNANTNVSMMGETFKYAAPIAGALGYTAEDTALAIGLMANAGIKGSQAGTSLRKMMTELSGEIKIAGEAIGTVTIQTTNADGSMRELNDILMDCREAFSHLSESEKAAAAEALVGKTAMSGFLAIMNASEADVNKLSEAIANCDGVSQQMADTMQDNLEGQLTILKSQLQELAISFGEILIPAIRGIVSAIQGVVDWLNSLSEGTKRIITTIALLVAAIGPVLIVVGKVMSAIGTIMTWAPKIAGAISTVMSWGPKIRTTVTNAWNTIKGVITSVMNAISSTVSSVWNSIKSTVTSLMNSISSSVQSIWNNMRSAIAGIISQIYSTISSGLNQAVSFVTGLIGRAYSWGRDLIMGIVNGIRSAIGAVADAARSVADAIRSVLHFSVPDEGPLTDYESWMPDFMKGLARGIEKSRRLVSDAMKDVASGMVLSPTIQAGSAGVAAVNGAEETSLIQRLTEALGQTGQGGGDITIPVYVGQDRIDEIVVTAAQRANYRSGGR